MIFAKLSGNQQRTFPPEAGYYMLLNYLLNIHLLTSFVILIE